MQTTVDDSGVSTRPLPTLPCSVVWSGGHSYVLEELGGSGMTRWMGLDARGRPLALTANDLQRRGWTLYPS